MLNTSPEKWPDGALLRPGGGAVPMPGGAMFMAGKGGGARWEPCAGKAPSGAMGIAMGGSRWFRDGGGSAPAGSVGNAGAATGARGGGRVGGNMDC